MPGVKKLLNSKNSETPTKDKLSDFVEEYWHYDNITKKSERQFVADYCLRAKKRRCHESKAKAKAIYDMALDGIPILPSGAASTKMLTLEAVRVLEEINRTLETILTQMQELATALPEYYAVRAVRGVGDVLASRLIAEIGDVRRFHNGSALIAYTGIDAPPQRCINTTKPADDAAVCHFMMKKEFEGKPKKVAKIAALNKFLRICYVRVMEVYQS